MSMKVIHITIIDQPGGRVSVRTNDQAPSIGRLLTAAETLSIDLLRACKARAQEVKFGADMPLIQTARRFLNPEDLGYVVGPHDRDDAREALGMPRVEKTGRPT